jgi:hypothetical protein
VSTAYDDLDVESQLMLEVIRQAGEIKEQDLFDALDALVGHYGSVETALTALKSGEAEFKRATLH